MIIYKVQNKTNGKIYVGQTRHSLDWRVRRHAYSVKYNSRLPFHEALEKYGFQSFDWSVIDEAENQEVLNEKEVYWIRFYNTKVPNGYNLTDGGEGINGIRRCGISEKTREAIRKSNRKRKWSVESRRKVRLSLTGRHHSEESKKKMSQLRKGRPKSEEHKRRIGEAHIGFRHSLKTRRKMSRSCKGRKLSKEHKKSISEGLRKHYKK